ncbi:carbohydrate kinase, YjeF related protein [Halorubrum californiense DSM 19288]|uniref:Bifunctional NAD(P)H-hydrate repair enzyme n=1 Tax=Halorubrum californiense DSM 19288 TaxID=1227465 RepID=M0ECL7_9EURY|nr:MULTISPECIES: bifunctional ADP-dependent NAD(P)H-hydrate dehydratase/NAD(P)H-hydrate epimerase [Halorubrum]ELZ44798.1 carbohydrate kinase, YjeF related protein [Halorubrum californiense DSM 19288]TKX64749.1 bifunctional ADP-dependent NAD(P)H-hydrate dehydratase/NAD(P)H-hydrate epimerase [Halorubrum sp. GN11GM_10-3_MGM]
MITTDRMAAVDANAAALGVPRKQLMESSGNAIAREVRAVAEPGATVPLVCGRGNNGGDALVAARFLDEYDVAVALLGRPETIRTDIARENWEALEAAEIPAETVTDSRDFDLTRPDGDDPDVIVDAMLGSGVSGGLREPERTAAAAINASDAPVVAVDVPSGIDADTGEPTGGSESTADGGEAVAVNADRVVTFHDEKPGLASLDAEVTVADIGIPAAAERFTGPGDLLGLDRDPDSHKGDNGEVLIVGGGPYTGAPTLSALAALRAGADLVRVACPESVASEVQGFSPNLIVRALPGDRVGPAHVDRVASLAAGVDTVVLGPGFGGGDGTEAFVRGFLTAYAGRAVVDADALRIVPDVDTDADLICTPHQGELVGMGGETASDPTERTQLVREFAAEVGHTLLVKGAVDVIADGDDVRLNRTGNPGMTVGGTGDVLAGTVGALAAVTEPFRAAAVGAYVVGRAGDAAAEANGSGLVATDLPDRLPEAMRNE